MRGELTWEVTGEKLTCFQGMTDAPGNLLFRVQAVFGAQLSIDLTVTAPT